MLRYTKIGLLILTLLTFGFVVFLFNQEQNAFKKEIAKLNVYNTNSLQEIAQTSTSFIRNLENNYAKSAAFFFNQTTLYKLSNQSFHYQLLNFNQGKHYELMSFVEIVNLNEQHFNTYQNQHNKAQATSLSQQLKSKQFYEPNLFNVEVIYKNNFERYVSNFMLSEHFRYYPDNPEIGILRLIYATNNKAYLLFIHQLDQQAVNLKKNIFKKHFIYFVTSIDPKQFKTSNLTQSIQLLIGYNKSVYTIKPYKKTTRDYFHFKSFTHKLIPYYDNSLVLQQHYAKDFSLLLNSAFIILAVLLLTLLISLLIKEETSDSTPAPYYYPAEEPNFEASVSHNEDSAIVEANRSSLSNNAELSTIPESNINPETNHREVVELQNLVAQKEADAQLYSDLYQDLEVEFTEAKDKFKHYYEETETILKNFETVEADYKDNIKQLTETNEMLSQEYQAVNNKYQNLIDELTKSKLITTDNHNQDAIAIRESAQYNHLFEPIVYNKLHYIYFVYDTNGQQLKFVTDNIYEILPFIPHENLITVDMPFNYLFQPADLTKLNHLFEHLSFDEVRQESLTLLNNCLVTVYAYQHNNYAVGLMQVSDNNQLPIQKDKYLPNTLKNIMNALFEASNHIEELNKEKINKKNIRDKIQSIQNEHNYILSVIDSLSNLYPNSSLETKEKLSIDFNELFEHLSKKIESLVKKEILVSFVIQKNIPDLSVDQNNLEKILLNSSYFLITDNPHISKLNINFKHDDNYLSIFIASSDVRENLNADYYEPIEHLIEQFPNQDSVTFLGIASQYATLGNHSLKYYKDSSTYLLIQIKIND